MMTPLKWNCNNCNCNCGRIFFTYLVIVIQEILFTFAGKYGQ